MKTASLLVLLALAAGCDRVPRRIVVRKGSGALEPVLRAVVGMESKAGCRLWDVIDDGGTAADWRGRFPPNGTVTVDTWPACYVPDDADGYTRWGARPVARVCLRGEDGLLRELVAHELGHAMGIQHTKERGVMYPRATWAFGPVLLYKLRRLCLD